MSGGEKSSAPSAAKNLLCGREDLLIVLAASGNIEQAEQDPFRAHSQGIVEIAGDSFSVGGGGNLRALNLRKLARDRLQGRRRFGRTGLK